MRYGLTAGSVAAVVAALVSLPLQSPSDTLFNTASVALAAIYGGLVAGVLWLVVPRSPRKTAYFVVAWTALFVPVALSVVLFGQAQLDNFVIFAVPLAAVIYGTTAIMTPVLAQVYPRLRWWVVGVALVMALALGLGLMTQSDQESGRLELPEPGSRVIPYHGPGMGDYSLTYRLTYSLT